VPKTANPDPLAGPGYIGTRELANHTGMSVRFWQKAVREHQMQTIKVGKKPRPGAQDRRRIQIWKPDARAIIERNTP